ncbi:MAG: ATP-binding protein [Acidimicrobiia bacterium]|nr:ATP-binding protein [Acidimicrobiia bacterium]
MVGEEGQPAERVETDELRADLDEAYVAWEDCLAEHGVFPPDEEDEAGRSPEELEQLWLEFEERADQRAPACARKLPSEELVALEELAAVGEEFSTTDEAFVTPAGAVQVVAAGSLDEASASLDSVRDVLLVVVPVLILLVAGLAWVATGRALRPVSAMSQRVNEIGDRTLHERVPVPASDDEIAELARTMNAMLDRLQGAVVAQQRFVSDSSHELRTPVAAIRTEIEVALARLEAEPGADPGWREVATRVLAEDDRLAALVEDMLVLARGDEGALVPDTEVDLDDIAYEQASRARGIAVDVSGVSPARVRGAARDLDRAVGHLLDNAARHARGRVWVRLTTTGGEEAVLEVADDGPGISHADRGRVVERFTRLDEDRSRREGGAGLGLAVVVSIAEAHHGRLEIDDRPGGGAVLRLVLPATAPP